MDRLRTTLNVTGDSVVTGIVASRTPKDDFDHLHDTDLEKPHHSITKGLTHMASTEDDSDPAPPESAMTDYKEPVMADASDHDTSSGEYQEEIPAQHIPVNLDSSHHA